MITCGKISQDPKTIVVMKLLASVVIEAAEEECITFCTITTKKVLSATFCSAKDRSSLRTCTCIPQFPMCSKVNSHESAKHSLHCLNLLPCIIQPIPCSMQVAEVHIVSYS